MSMVVRSNINSMNANRNLSKNNSMVAKSIEKLSSGYAINRAADDASGLAVSEKMRAQITGLDQGTSNTLEGIGLVQTAEGALNEIHEMLNRIVELATKSANGTIQDEVDREAIQAEVDVLIDEIDRIAQSTNYNGIPLLNGMDTNTLINTDYYDGTLTSKIATAFFNVSSGVSSTNSYTTNGTTQYRSDGIYLANGATSVPSGSILPYVISMEIVSYDETNSTEGTGSLIETKTITLTVNTNGTVVGNNGSGDIDFTNMNVKSNWDTLNGGNGYDYVSNPPEVTTSEMKVIMEYLLNDQSYDLNLGGYTGYSSPANGSIYDSNPPYDPSSGSSGSSLYIGNNTYPTYPAGTSVSDYVPAEYYYGQSVSSSTTTGSAYGSLPAMYVYGGSGYTNDGRVLGVVSTVTSGGVDQDSVGSPSGFDVSQWYSGVDVNDCAAGEILGIYPSLSTLGESPRSEILIPTPVTQADVAAMTPQEIAALVVTIEQVLTEYPDCSEYSDYPTYPNDPYDGVDEIVTKKYVTVINPFTDTSMFGSDVTIIYGDPNDPEHYVIDDLCEQISNDFTLVDTDYIPDTGETEDPLRVTRKVDNVYYDVPTDANAIDGDRYTLQLGKFYQTEYSWAEEPYKDETWEILEDPIILHVADQEELFNKVGIYIQNMRVEAMGIEGLDVSTQESAGLSINIIKDAINYVSVNRGSLGADQNRLESTVNVNNNTSENMTSARSVIKDCDMAKEMIQYTKMDVLTQSAQAMLAQSNTAPQAILELLG